MRKIVCLCLALSTLIPKSSGAGQLETLLGSYPNVCSPAVLTKVDSNELTVEEWAVASDRLSHIDDDIQEKLRSLYPFNSSFTPQVNLHIAKCLPQSLPFYGDGSVPGLCRNSNGLSRPCSPARISQYDLYITHGFLQREDDDSLLHDWVVMHGFCAAQRTSERSNGANQSQFWHIQACITRQVGLAKHAEYILYFLHPNMEDPEKEAELLMEYIEVLELGLPYVSERGW